MEMERERQGDRMIAKEGLIQRAREDRERQR